MHKHPHNEIRISTLGSFSSFDYHAHFGGKKTLVKDTAFERKRGGKKSIVSQMAVRIK